MATIATARQKLEIKQKSMPGKYNDRMAAFIGVSPAQIASSPAGQSYSAKISDPSMPARWERNLKAAFGA